MSGWRKSPPAARASGRAKSPGAVAQRLMGLLLLLVVKTMNVEKTMAAEQRYTIDWNAPVQEDAAALA